MRNQTEKIVLSGLFIAIGVILPSLFHAAGIGQQISPMHFPALLAGVILGWKYGLAVGLLTPLLSGLMFGMPPLFPTATVMSLELGTYALISGIITEKVKPFKNQIYNIYLGLLVAMILGRIVYGISYAVIMGISGETYGFRVYISSVLLQTWPGIILQFLVIPPIVVLYQKRLKNPS
ncbi:MAG: ECF transporter S component [Acholeplasmataceae bacterium]|nr:ECF transporter S component [Acholeplasmataceae bacterium]